MIGRHSHPKAKPETATTSPAPTTGINYLELVAADHHQATAAGINFHALTDTTHRHRDTHDATPDTAEPSSNHAPGQVPGQMPLPGMPPVPGLDPAGVEVAGVCEGEGASS